MPDTNPPSFIETSEEDRLAYHSHSGSRDFGLLWLGGFKSDMDGTKALAIEDWAKGKTIASTRFDYFAHGRSSGEFTKGTISKWLADAELILKEICKEPQILIGSSMGGWIAILLALSNPDLVKSILLIAPAPDFTGDLMWDGFDDDIKAQLREGIPYEQPSQYGEEPYLITPELIEDGRQNFVLERSLNLTCPIRILQGMEDPDVPWQRSLRLMDQINSPDIDFTLVKTGDHRFSDPHCLHVLRATLQELVDAR